MQSEVIRLIWHHCEGVLLVFCFFLCVCVALCVYACVFLTDVLDYMTDNIAASGPW